LRKKTRLKILSVLCEKNKIKNIVGSVVCNNKCNITSGRSSGGRSKKRLFLHIMAVKNP